MTGKLQRLLGAGVVALGLGSASQAFADCGAFNFKAPNDGPDLLTYSEPEGDRKPVVSLQNIADKVHCALINSEKSMNVRNTDDPDNSDDVKVTRLLSTYDTNIQFQQKPFGEPYATVSKDQVIVLNFNPLLSEKDNADKGAKVLLGLYDLALKGPIKTGRYSLGAEGLEQTSCQSLTGVEAADKAKTAPVACP